MKLKRAEEKSLMLDLAAKAYQKRKFSILAFTLYTFLVFAAGIYLHKLGFFSNYLTPFLEKNVSVIPKIIDGAFARPERIIIDIKHTDFQKLAYQRELALHSGVLIKSDEDYVKGQIRQKDKTVKVKLRLKGDWTDHLQGDKWSYRVVVRGEESIFGMKTFSIQHPKTRNYISEWLFHKLLKHEGLIALRYDFINVTLNGKDFGVYALEEHFEKRLIEHNALREGPIIKFNENMLWTEKVQQRIPFPNAAANGAGLYLSSDIDGFQTNKWLADSTTAALYSRAIHLLESFRRGILTTSEVFDIPKLAKFFAIVDLAGGKHAAIWHNFRFYYNPVTSRLEPIGFDADCGHPIEYLLATAPSGLDGEITGNGYANYSALLFKDMAFFNEYMQALERVSQSEYLDGFFSKIGVEFEQKLNILYSEFPHYESPKDIFYSNQHYIRTALMPVKSLHAYFRNNSGQQITLDLGNIQSLPVEVLDVSYKDSLIFSNGSEVILSGHSGLHLVDYTKASFAMPAHFAWEDSIVKDLKVRYKILGTSQLRAETVFPFQFLDEQFIHNDFVRQHPNVYNFDFLSIDETIKEIRFKPGRWTVKHSLIIPGGYTIFCDAGTQLDLSNQATILSYSPLQFIGNEESPIVIQSSDSSGQGLIVMNAGQKSVLRYIRFDNLSNPLQGGWSVTGAVSFYESPVEISHCEFANNRCEDGLNIVRSDYTIDNTLFIGAQSDAFDGDFTKGRMTNVRFVNCGNDGIDISGSLLDVQNIFIDGSGDKGLSAGENSQMTVNNAEIKNAEIAVSSKDLSTLTANNIKLTNSKIGFTPFQKKAEFGPATIRVTNLKMDNTKIPFLVEENSTLVVEGKEIPTSRKNVKEILYGVEFGKSSR